MVRSQNRTLTVIPILMMLGASPLSVSYSFADTEDSQRGVGIVTEKVVDGELQVHHYSLPEDYTKEDTRRILTLDDQVSNWAYVNFKAYNSGIILFDGKISKIGDRHLQIEFIKESNLSQIQEKTALEEFNYSVVFSGKTSEIGEENEFIIYLINSSLKNPEISQSFKFLQIGDLTRNFEISNGPSQEFRNLR